MKPGITNKDARLHRLGTSQNPTLPTIVKFSILELTPPHEHGSECDPGLQTLPQSEVKRRPIDRSQKNTLAYLIGEPYKVRLYSNPIQIN